VIDVALENAARNGFGAAMHVSDIGLEHIDGVFEAIVANIRSEVLITMAPTIARRASAGGLLLLSGVLASEREAVAHAFLGDFEHLETRTHQEGEDAWVAIAMTRAR
jgi:ribosomal protein L11 methyltransferase